MIFDDVFKLFLNAGGQIFGALTFPILSGGSCHQTRHPELTFEMIIGMILIEKMPAGPDTFGRFEDFFDIAEIGALQEVIKRVELFEIDHGLASCHELGTEQVQFAMEGR